MLDMLKRHEIQVLRKAGLEQEKVATIAGVSERSVRRVEAEAPVTVVDTAGSVSGGVLAARGRRDLPAVGRRFAQGRIDDVVSGSAAPGEAEGVQRW